MPSSHRDRSPYKFAEEPAGTMLSSVIHFIISNRWRRTRGEFCGSGGDVSYISPEARVFANHPPRKIRALVRYVLRELNRSLGRLYSAFVDFSRATG
jgi:hypothetical protein